MIRVETLSFQPPLDWIGLLGFFGPRAIPGVEAVVNGELRRSLRSAGSAGTLSTHWTATSLQLQVQGPAEFLDTTESIVQTARRVFDLDSCAIERLRCFARDPVLGPLAERWPGVRLPGAWDGFEMGVRAILGQQVTVKAAHTLAGRVARKYGTPLDSPFPEVTTLFPQAATLAAAPVEELAGLGLTRKRAETLHSFAVWWSQDRNGNLLDLPGIGPWTEHYIRMRAHSEPDAFPAADLGIHKALGLHGIGPAKAAKAAELQSLAWRPWRAYAVILLWRSLGEKP